jgi:hypothetical protein
VPIIILLYYIGGIVIAAGVFGAFMRFLWRTLRPVWRLFRQLLTDWHGEPPRPGFDGVPGVMVRIKTVEDTVKYLKAEVQTDHGTTLRDAVNRTETRVANIERRQTRLEKERADREAKQ